MNSNKIIATAIALYAIYAVFLLGLVYVGVKIVRLAWGG